ncbi:MAG: hypothetical protein U1E36_02330 [Rickettsiales bacterium]
MKRIQISLDGVNITYQPNGIMEVYEQITGKGVIRVTSNQSQKTNAP